MDRKYQWQLNIEALKFNENNINEIATWLYDQNVTLVLAEDVSDADDETKYYNLHINDEFIGLVFKDNYIIKYREYDKPHCSFKTKFYIYDDLEEDFSFEDIFNKAI